MKLDPASFRDNVGKTVAAIAQSYKGVRSYWLIVWTDGTTTHLVSDSDYSDIYTSIEVINDPEEFFYDSEEEDEDGTVS